MKENLPCLVSFVKKHTLRNAAVHKYFLGSHVPLQAACLSENTLAPLTAPHGLVTQAPSKGPSGVLQVAEMLCFDAVLCPQLILPVPQICQPVCAQLSVSLSPPDCDKRNVAIPTDATFFLLLFFSFSCLQQHLPKMGLSLSQRCAK